MRWSHVSLAALCALAGCGGGGGAPASSPAPGGPAPVPPPAPKSFIDATAASNIQYVVNYTLPPTGTHITELAASTNGGAAAGDCDADGDIDLFITYGDGGPNRLYLNQWNLGNALKFADVAESAGVANTRDDGRGNDRHSGPIFADIDGDSDLDLFIGGLFTDPNKLYSNNGDCTFEDVTAGSGLDNLAAEHTLSATFGDYDLDGRLDLFLTHWGARVDTTAPIESDHLFRNVSDGSGIRFENVSAATGVTAHIIAASLTAKVAPTSEPLEYTFTPSIARINDDLWPDIAVASDFGTSQLLLHDPNLPGTFVDATGNAIRSVEFGMGSALGDVDFDGDLDWFITSISGTTAAGDVYIPTGNRLLLNPGGSLSVIKFQDFTTSAGIRHGMWGWGACFLDIDNDTDLDIYHTNGWSIILDHNQYDQDSSRAFVGDGTGKFTNQASQLGLNDRNSGRGVVCADFDNDGDTDILQLTTHSANSASLWENVRGAAGRNSLRIRLIGLPPNTEAAGARIFVTVGARTQMREVRIGSNYISQNPALQIFGLDSAASIDELRVEWPPLAPGPVQPGPTRRTLVPATAPGTTLIVCHPDLDPAPPVCD